jgi:hypothetical protein
MRTRCSFLLMCLATGLVAAVPARTPRIGVLRTWEPGLGAFGPEAYPTVHDELAA